MAADGASEFMALCAVASFLWLSSNLEHHQLIEYPRQSSLLILLISGIAAYVASFFSLLLPGANGRFDDERQPLKNGPVNLPKKPRRFYIVLLVACLVQRLELFHKTTLDLQCSTPGIEAFLPVLVLVYELLPGRRSRTEPRIRPDHDYMLDSNYDYLVDITQESKVSLIIATSLVAWGAYLATSRGVKSSFFCSTLLDDPAALLVTQWAGLVLDGVIAILLWRILAWARTTKNRLRTLSGILLSSAFGTALMYFALGKLYDYQPVTYTFKGLDSLYIFDLFMDGMFFSVFIISSGLLICESTPLTLAGIATFAAGLLAACRRLYSLGTWQNVAPASTLGSILLLCTGFSLFTYANGLRSVAMVRRAFLVILLIILIIAAVVTTCIVGSGVVGNHPLYKLIYDTRIEADRWLVHATVSKTLRVAVQEYQDRHYGRSPPPKYDIWYNFAVENKSPILDHFPQIAKDIEPFWGIAPSKIRDDISRVANEPDIIVLRIRDGKPLYDLPVGSPHGGTMGQLVSLIKPFLQHIPDMALAINLNEAPRLLTPWDDLRRLREAAKRKGAKKLFPRSDPEGGVNTEPTEPPPGTTQSEADFTSAKAFREMTALTCPHNAPGRSGVHWDVRDFCASCAGPQSRGQYLTDLESSLEICHQPDLFRLHTFYMTSPEVRPLQELLPVFSRAKTDSYADILIPLPRPNEKDPENAETVKWKKLYWRGKVTRPSTGFTPEIWRGGQQERLVHLVNNGTEKSAILMPTGNENEFRHDFAATKELNAVLPLDIGFSEYTACTSPDSDCGLLQGEFGLEPEVESKVDNLYVLLVDGDAGPPDDVKYVLQSGSVPLIASIFKEWYTDRLMPWLHFVPIDIRFHALHSTLAYFTGARGAVNGRETEWRDNNADANWIAEQGRRWANRALRKEDMQVYLFRLLLEWGRLVDDRRDELGFVYTEGS